MEQKMELATPLYLAVNSLYLTYVAHDVNLEVKGHSEIQNVADPW